jgi:hypothetical protein
VRRFPDGFRNETNQIRLNPPVSGVEFIVAFQRKKPAAIGVKALFPGFIEPALATSIEKVPSGERWSHEIKFDGYRVQVHLVNEANRIAFRRGNLTRLPLQTLPAGEHLDFGPPPP